LINSNTASVMSCKLPVSFYKSNDIILKYDYNYVFVVFQSSIVLVTVALHVDSKFISEEASKVTFSSNNETHGIIFNNKFYLSFNLIFWYWLLYPQKGYESLKTYSYFFNIIDRWREFFKGIIDFHACNSYILRRSLNLNRPLMHTDDSLIDYYVSTTLIHKGFYLSSFSSNYHCYKGLRNQNHNIKRGNWVRERMLPFFLYYISLAI